MKLEQVVERRQGTYAAVRYDVATTLAITDWMRLWKVPNPITIDHLHTTLIYSRTVIPQERQCHLNETVLDSLGWKIVPSSLAIFGNDDERVLVMKIDSPDLVSFHEMLIKLGATHDFPDYQPHVTLSYDLPSDFNWQRLTPPMIQLRPVELYFEPLDLNWSQQ